MAEAEEGEETATVASSPRTNGRAGGPSGAGGAIDYDYGLYKTFWDVQVREN